MDSGAPYEATSKLVGEIMGNASTKVYEKAGHGLYITHATQVMNDILHFVHSVEITQMDQK